MAVSFFSPAKLNLFLAVTGQRADGFHDLVSVAAPLDFGDELAAKAGPDPSAIVRAGSLSLDDLDTARKHASRWRDAGYGYLVCGWPGAGRDHVERFAREVMPELS